MVGRAVQTVRFLFESKSLPVSRATLGIQQINGAQPSPRVSAHALPTAPGPAGGRRGVGGGLARAQNPPHAPPGRGIDAVLGPVPGHSLGGSGPPPPASLSTQVCHVHQLLTRPPRPPSPRTTPRGPNRASVQVLEQSRQEGPAAQAARGPRGGWSAHLPFSPRVSVLRDGCVSGVVRSECFIFVEGLVSFRPFSTTCSDYRA